MASRPGVPVLSGNQSPGACETFLSCAPGAVGLRVHVNGLSLPADADLTASYTVPGVREASSKVSSVAFPDGQEGPPEGAWTFFEDKHGERKLLLNGIP